MNLTNKYSEINGRSTPTEQHELLAPVPEYCRAIWALGDWIPTLEFNSFMNELELMCSTHGIIYTVSGKNAQLHWTLMQIETFPVDTDKIQIDDAYKFRSIISKHPPFTIIFKGMSKTRNGIFLCGYPSYDVNKIRDDIRSCTADLKEPHPQDICHSTLFRLTHAPNNEMNVWFNSLYERYANIELLRFVPRRWEYGFGTWRQLDSERKVIISWNSAPRWILHRGLCNGPDKHLENNEQHIKMQIANGWDVEIDIWKIGNDWILGHDAPLTKLVDISILESKHVWVHCKNLEALKAAHESTKMHYFTHNIDPATLTSQNWMWCFPGHHIGRGSVCVMPERTGLGISEICMAGAVCSDYNPSAFY